MASKDLNDTLGFGKSAEELGKLNKALSSSFNSSLGMLDLSKFKTELKDVGVSAQTLGKAFKDGGAQGQIAFNNLLGQIGKIDTGLKRSSNTVDKMFNTIANTARWGVVSSGFSAVLNSLHESVNYVKELDDAMTQIMLVTDYSRGQMNDYAKSANEAAKALGNTTVGVMQGTQVFAQQGYDLQQSGQLAELSIKLANASEQDSATTSDQITALMNAYGLNKDMGALSSALDSWAKVANVSAADVEELAKASQKAASTAATVDVSLEQLNAQIATIESVTKEAPEQIGNGLKTLYARFSDLKAGKTLEDGVSLGKVTSVLQGIGVEVLDAEGKMRGVGDMMEDMMEVWSDLDSTQKAAIAQTVAGKYQLGRFEALMNAPEMYDEYAKASMNAEGTLDEMNAEYLDSLAGKTAKLQATLEGLFNSVFNPDNFYPAIDALTKFIEIINKFVDSVGGGQTVLTGLIALFGKLFSNNMAQMITDASANRQMDKIRQQNAENVPAILDQLGYNNTEKLSAEQNQMVDYVKYIQANQGSMSEQQANIANQTLEEGINSLNKYEDIFGKVKDSARELSILIGAIGDSTKIHLDENGKPDIFAALEVLQNMNSTDLKNLKGNFAEKLRAELETVSEKINEINTQGKLLVESTSDEAAGEAFNKLAISVDDARDSLEKIKPYIMPEDYQQLAAAINEAQEQYAELGGETDKAVDKGKKAIIIAENLKNVLGLTTSDISKSNNAAAKGILRGLRTQSDLSGAEASRDNALRSMQGVIDINESRAQTESIINNLNAVNELSFAWQSFQNLGSLWKNNDLSFGEKLFQTITNLSMALPAFIEGAQKIKDLGGLKNLFSTFKDFAKVQLNKINPIAIADNKIDSTKNNWNAFGEVSIKNAEKSLEETKIRIAALEQEKIKLQNRFDAIGEEIQQNSQNKVSAFRKNNNKGKAQAQERTKLLGLYSEKGKVSREIQEIDDKINGLNGTLQTGEENLGKFKKSFANMLPSSSEVGVLEKMKIGFSGLFSSIKDFVIGNFPILALTAITSAISAYQKSLDEARENANKLFDESKNKYEDISSQVQNFDTLYNTWKETGEGADQLTEAGKELSETLNIIGGDALAAGEKFDILKEKISGAVDKSALDVISNAQNMMQKNSSYGIGNISNIQGDAVSLLQDLENSSENVKKIFEEKGIDPLTTKYDEMMGTVKLALDSIYERMNAIEDKDSDEYKDLLQQYNRTNELYNKEEWQKYREGSEISAEATLSTDAFKKKIEETNGEVEKLWNLFSTDPGVGNYFKNLANDAERFNFLLKNINDEQAKLNIMTEYSKSQAMSLTQDQTAAFGANPSIAAQFKQQGVTEDQVHDVTQGLVYSAIQQVKDSSELTPDQKNELLASVDWTGPIDEIIGTLMQSAKDGVVIKDYSDTADTTQRETLLTEKYDISESTQNAMRSMAQDSEIVKNTQNELNEEYKKAAESLQGYTDKQIEQARAGEEVIGLTQKQSRELQENIKKTDKAEKAVEGYKDSIDDLADMVMQTQKGLDSLSEGWEKNGDILKDSAKKGTLEYAEALGEIQSSLADVLNVEQEYVSATFIQDHLAEIEEIANGDISSLDDLRAAAAQDILVNLNTGLADKELDYLTGKLDEWAHMDVEAVTTINDEQAINALDKLLSKGKITAADLNAVLNSVQTDPQVEMVPGPTGNYIHIPAKSIPINVLGFDVGGIDVPDMDIEIQTAVPKITSLNKMPGGGNGGGGGFPSYTPPSNTSGSGGNSRGGGGSCFVAGTKISTQTGFKNIEKIQIGDIVLSYNEQIKKNEYSEVLQTMIHNTTENIYTLYIQNEKLRVTGIHKFFIIKEDKTKWIAAENLQIGDYVLYADGTKHQIFKIKINLETQTVYNFEVSNNHNYYVGYNQILVHNKGGGKGKTPRTGGSGKSSKPKTKDPMKEQLDLYEKVNTKLEDVEAVLKKIQKETDRLIGPQATANMNKQLSLLQKEITLQYEKLRIQDKERKNLQKKLKDDYGIAFDKNGFIDNYDVVFKRLKSDYNELIAKYNKSNPEQQEAMEDDLKKAKDKFDKFKEDYSRYDELQGKEIQETKNAIEELKDAMEDLRIEAYKSAMEAQEQLKELGDDMAHFNAVISDNKLDSPLANLIENTGKLNNLFSSGKKSATDYYTNLIAEQRKLKAETKDKSEKRAIQMQIDFYKEQRNRIANGDDLYAGGAIQAATDRLSRALEFAKNPNRGDNPFKGNMAALYEEIENARKNLSELIEEAKKALEDQEKYVIERIQELEEKQEYFIDQLQTVNDHMEKTMDIYNLAFGEENYEDMIDAYTRIAQTTQASFDQAKANYEYWKKIWDGMSEKERMEDVGKQAREEVNKWKGQMLDSEKEIVEYWGEVFTATTKKAMQDAAKTTFGRSNLDDIEANWQRDNDFSSRYYDDFQKQQRVEALRLKYMDLLDNAQNASLDTQRKIRDSMNQQVKYLEDQKYLSEYNVKYANAQLEILQKQIALEDARNNKNQMRLRRDSQGNYRYVYSANKDDTRQKEQDLLQSQMDVYDMSKQNKSDTTQAAFDLWRSTMEQLQALEERARQGDEDAIKAREELLKDYQRAMEAYGLEYKASTDGMIKSVQWMAESGIDSVQDVAAKALEALTSNNHKALQEMGIEGDAFVDNILEKADTASSAINQAVIDMDEAITQYHDHLIGTGGVIDNIKEGYSGISDAIGEASKATDDLVKATREFQEVIRPEDGVLQDYIKQIETLRQNVSSLTNENSEAVLRVRQAEESEQKAKTAATQYKLAFDTKNGDRNIERGSVFTLKKGTWVYYGRGGGQSDNKDKRGFELPYNMQVKVYETDAKKWGQDDPDIIAKYPISFYATGDSLKRFGPRVHDDNSDEGRKPEHKKHEVWHLDDAQFRKAITMDTGGYTGEWANGSDKKNGRFAMLHQKEMVLNESDTKNILEAVEMVRTMTDVLKLIGNMSSYKGTGFNKLGGDTIKQRVEITAEFPNVSNSNEIETALLSLADSAYQYSYRER